MCLFCKIANGEINSYKVYEDNDFLAFLDISQQTYGHTLVVPKKHSSNIFELDEETSTKYMTVISKVANILKEKLGINDLNIFQNNGSLAGQTVNHIHFHLVPRYENDGFYTPVDRKTNIDILEVYQKLTK